MPGLVNIAPLEGEQLAQAHAGTHREEEERVVSRLEGVEELVDLRLRNRIAVYARPVRIEIDGTSSRRRAT